MVHGLHFALCLSCGGAAGFSKLLELHLLADGPSTRARGTRSTPAENTEAANADQYGSMGTHPPGNSRNSNRKVDVAKGHMNANKTTHRRPRPSDRKRMRTRVASLRSRIGIVIRDVAAVAVSATSLPMIVRVRRARRVQHREGLAEFTHRAPAGVRRSQRPSVRTEVVKPALSRTTCRS